MAKIYLNEGDTAVFTINGKEVEVTKMRITPENAENIITESDKKFNNRKTTPTRFSLYAKDMENDNWKINGETIKFREDGACIDGKHRLTAICKSNKTQEMLAVMNLEHGVEDTIDIGTKRSLEHALQIQGEAYETGVGSIVKMKMQLDNKNHSRGANEGVLGLTRVNQVNEFVNNRELYKEAARFAKIIQKESKRALTLQEIGGIYAHLKQTLGYDKEIIEDFFIKLVSAPLNSTSIFSTTLHNHLSDKKKCRNSDRTNEFIKCFNSFRNGNERKRVGMDAFGGWFVKSDGTNY